MKAIVLLLIIFCLCEGQKNQSGKPKPKPRPKPRPRPKPPIATGCPKGWRRFRDTDRCYYISRDSETFESASDICLEKKSQLATPLTFDDQYDLNDLLVAHRRRCFKRENCDEFWIGIHRRLELNATEGKWMTPIGIPIDAGAQCHYFSRRFPDIKEGNCVIMSLRGSDWRGVWRGANCTRKFKFVCVTCPNNFIYFPEINECLKFNPIKANWSEAQKTCAKFKKGAQLLTIQYAMKQQIVETYFPPLLANSTVCDFDKGDVRKKYIWLGAQTLYPDQCHTPYYWKPVRGPSIPLYYTNWLPGMPNCGSKGENCAAIATTSDSKQWDDLPCSEKFCYVCEF